MDLERNGNFVEAGLWFTLALALFIHTFRREKPLRATLVTLAFTLAVFGGSDLVEAHTGAWWTPWWLLVWKALCVVVLFSCFMRYHQLTKKIRAAARETEANVPSRAAE